MLEHVAQKHLGFCELPEFAARPAYPPPSLCGPMPHQWNYASKAEYGGVEWPSLPLTSKPELEGPIPRWWYNSDKLGTLLASCEDDAGVGSADSGAICSAP